MTDPNDRTFLDAIQDCLDGGDDPFALLVADRPNESTADDAADLAAMREEERHDPDPRWTTGEDC